MSLYFLYFFIPLGVGTTVLIIVNKFTKTRCGQIKYLISIIIVSALQVVIAYYPTFMIFHYYSNILWDPFILLLLLVINIHISTKRFNDTDMDEANTFMPYLSSMSTLILYLVHFIFLGGFYRLGEEPRYFYLAVLVIMNIIPIIDLAIKKSDITIRFGETPVDYIDIFGTLFRDNDINIIKIDTHYVYINNFQFSIKHDQNKHVITSYRDTDNEHFFTKFVMHNGIQKFGFHYMNTYYEFTDEEYNNMIEKIKNLKNVIFIDHPYIVINNVNVLIREDGAQYSVTLLKSDRDKFYDEINVLKRISEKEENDQYECYKRIEKKELLWFVKQCLYNWEDNR